MKERLFDRIVVGLFCGFLAVMCVCYLFLPTEDFSALEKRYLEDPPEFSWKTLASGEWGEAVEQYLADHIPGRNFFVGLNAYFVRMTGRQASMDIYAAKDGRLVEAPAVWDQDRVEKNMDAILQFSEKTGQDMYLMLIPSAGWAAAEDVFKPAKAYNDQEMIRWIYEMAGSTVQTVDLTELFHGRKEWYFKTDHHWNSRGAYEGYCAWCLASGREPVPEETFRIGQYGDFFGSTYSRSALWLTKPDSLELWISASDLTVVNGESDDIHTGPYYWNRLEETDKYTVNLDGNHSVVRVTNPAGSGKLLVIRDSFANSMGVFLAESYETVLLVDLRYYKAELSALCREEGFDEILVCYSLSNFLTDANLVWLR